MAETIITPYEECKETMKTVAIIRACDWISVIDWTPESREDGTCDIKTLSGTIRADKGDYIIQGLLGDIYPCKPDIFEQTYEVAE